MRLPAAGLGKGYIFNIVMSLHSKPVSGILSDHIHNKNAGSYSPSALPIEVCL